MRIMTLMIMMSKKTTLKMEEVQPSLIRNFQNKTLSLMNQPELEGKVIN